MEVAPEEQAAMAIKLSDNVRQLIRDEMKAALQDWGFLASLDQYALANSLIMHYRNNSEFRKLVAEIISSKMAGGW